MFVPLTPLRFLDRVVEHFASKVGVICGDKEFTYGQFADRARRLASGLPATGFRKGDRVAFLSFNNHQLLEGYYGVVQAQGIVMPLNVRLSAAELAVILNHSEAAVVFYEADFAATIEQLKTECPKVRSWLELGDPYEKVLEEGVPEPADIMSVPELAIAELFYTSGSTGTPKGVAMSHRTLYLHCLSAALAYRELDHGVDLHTIPLFHGNGWGRPQLALMFGSKQVMVRRFEPALVLAQIEKHRATHVCMVPTMVNAILSCPDLSTRDVSSLNQIIIGGAATSPELIERVESAFGCECLVGYGLTETAPTATVSRRKNTITYANNQERYRRQAMAGWTVPGMMARVVDATGDDVPRDGKTMGEVILMGDHVMDGYYKEPEQTAAVMEGGWLHTGDIAVWDEDGYLKIVDRKKEIIVSGGENISSIEVERAIAAHPAVFEVAVVAAPDEKWGEVPAAVVVLKEGAATSSDELKEFAAEKIGRFKLPRIIEFSEDPLPKTGTGKIRKMLIKERFWLGHDKRVKG